LTIEESVYRGALRPYTKTTEEGETDRLTLPVPLSALYALARWREVSNHTTEDDFIFSTESGTFWRVENYQRRVLTPLAKSVGIDHLNFQIMRRSVATHAQHLGSPKDITTVMRHKREETAAQHYIQVIEQTVRDTTERLAAKLLD
jgi:site-specific recombinase XerC